MPAHVVKVFGGEPPCAKCKNVEKAFREAIKELNLDAEVVHVSAMSDEADEYGVMMAPTVVIDGKVAVSGKVPSKDEAARILRKEIGQ